MEPQIGSSNYDVFINFRGEDTRNNFVGHLHKALKHRGINAFIDSEDLWKGEDIGDALLGAIKNSKLSIAVLSERYAESSWCLRELTQILESHRTDGQIIFPIFFKVHTSNVKNQTGCFEISAQRHIKEAPETLQSWKQTLRAIGDKSGWVFNTGDDESELVEDVVKKTWIRMNIAPLIDIKNPVGLESRVESMLSLLSHTSNIGNRDVQFVGICGQGGMGKTTIATVVYNCIAKNFSKSCFIGDVREKASRTNGIICLQEELLYGISRTETKICSSQEGSRLIKERFQNMKTILILDDVGDRTQLDALARDLSWFGSGSKIIVTTRDQSVLGGVPKNCRKIFEPQELNAQESLQLFSLNAFSKEEPPEDYKDLSVNIVCTTGGLPLALEVLGCDLSMIEGKEVWESKLRVLEQLPDDTVYEKLKTTFDDLHDIEKSMFLDAACFFIQWNVEIIIPIWEACGFEPICRLENLKRKSLIKIQKPDYSKGQKSETLLIHDQIRDMGRRIAYNQRPENPNCHSRLWSRDNIMKGCKGNEIVEGIIPSFPGLEKACLCLKDFEKMHELRLLQVDTAILKGNFQCLPSRLRWLSWHYCPLEKLPADLYHEELVALDLSHGGFRQAWNKWPQNKLFQQLKVLKLDWCDVLSESPDFSGFPRLEKLVLSHCFELANLHESIGELKQLVFLDLTYCLRLGKLPNSICKLSSLKELDLSKCTSLEELPDNICSSLSSLQKLGLQSCESLKELPEDIVLLKLEVLDLSYNEELLQLPRSMVTMTSLRELNLRGCHKLLCIPKLPPNLIIFRFGESIFEGTPYIQNPKNMELFQLGIYSIKVEKFRGFVETSRIGDEFNELISKLGTSCCVVTVPRCSRLAQAHQETVPRDINTASRRQIWVPLQKKTAEKGRRFFSIPNDDEISSSSCRLAMHVSLGVRHYDSSMSASRIYVDVAARIHRKDGETKHQVRLSISDDINSHRPGDHIEFIHEFQGVDWFGVLVEGGESIEVTYFNLNPTRESLYPVRLNRLDYSLRAVNLFLIKEGPTMFDEECHSYSCGGDHDSFLQIVRCPRTTEDEDISQPTSEDEDVPSEEMTCDIGETQNRVTANGEDTTTWKLRRRMKMYWNLRGRKKRRPLMKWMRCRTGPKQRR